INLFQVFPLDYVIFYLTKQLTLAGYLTHFPKPLLLLVHRYKINEARCAPMLRLSLEMILQNKRAILQMHYHKLNLLNYNVKTRLNIENLELLHLIDNLIFE